MSLRSAFGEISLYLATAHTLSVTVLASQYTTPHTFHISVNSAVELLSWNRKSLDE